MIAVAVWLPAYATVTYKIHACCHFQLIVVVCLSLPLSFIVTATAVTIIIVASATGSYPVLQMYWRTAEAALHRSHLHPIVLPPVAVVVPPARVCCLWGPFLLLSEATISL